MFSNQTQVKMVKRKIIEEFRYVVTDGENILKPITCSPSEIEVVPDDVSIQISTGRKLLYAFRD